MISSGAHFGTCNAGAEPFLLIVFSDQATQSASRLERRFQPGLQKKLYVGTAAAVPHHHRPDNHLPHRMSFEKRASERNLTLAIHHRVIESSTGPCSGSLLERFACGEAGRTCGNSALARSASAAMRNESDSTRAADESRWRGSRSRPLRRRSLIHSWTIHSWTIQYSTNRSSTAV
jgi:hypothetical protein